MNEVASRVGMTATEYHERRPNAGAPPAVAPHAFVAAKTSCFVWQRVRSSVAGYFDDVSPARDLHTRSEQSREAEADEIVWPAAAVPEPGPDAHVEYGAPRHIE